MDIEDESVWMLWTSSTAVSVVATAIERVNSYQRPRYVIFVPISQRERPRSLFFTLSLHSSSETMTFREFSSAHFSDEAYFELYPKDFNWNLATMTAFCRPSHVGSLWSRPESEGRHATIIVVEFREEAEFQDTGDLPDYDKKTSSVFCSFVTSSRFRHIVWGV